jgi:hypothetical protein
MGNASSPITAVCITQSSSTHQRLCREAGQNKAHVAIVNDVNYHNEVYVALLWSFVRTGASVDVFVHTHTTWDIESVIRDWYAHHRYALENL